jgi:Coenzyme PQQ synthesis protein D (PqqD)
MPAPEELIRLRSEDLEWTEIDDEVVVLDLRDSTYLSVNRTGAALWTALAEGSTRSALLARLRERFDVDEAAAERGLDDFLTVVRKRGLLAG